MLTLIAVDEASRQNRPDTRWTYAYVKKLILEESPNKSAGAKAWGRRTATAEDIEAAAIDLLAESDPKRIAGYLRIFSERRFPRTPDTLLALSRHDDENVREGAVDALRQFSDPRVRAFALQLRRTPKQCGTAVELLSANYEDGDYGLLEELLRQPLSRSEFHSLTSGVFDFVNAHESPDAVQALLLIYENSSCSYCRFTSVRLLCRVDALPDWMREECRHDSEEDIRELAESTSPPLPASDSL